MTTKTDITLLPCPFCGGEAEIDTRQGYLALGTGRLGNRIAAYCRGCNADMGVCIEDVPDIEPEQVANMWNRRAAVEADRQGRMPSNEEIEACGSGGPMSLVIALDFAENPRPFGSLAAPADTNGELYKALRVLAAEYRALVAEADALLSGQPAASMEPSGYAYRYPDCIRFNDGREVNGCKPTETLPYWFGAAPVAQEPVGVVGDDFALYWIGSGPIAPIVERHGLKVGSKLYASPAAAQAQPDVQTLIAYAEGRIKHVNEGECPDNIEGHDTRDPDCPVCRALMGTIHAQPAMPPLTEAMRAVLRNENDIYDSEDAMYAALCDAAQAQPSASLKPDMQRESQRGAESGRDREDAHNIEAAAKTLAECMDYPWEPMPEKGREAMRKHAKRVIDAARAAKGADHG